MLRYATTISILVVALSAAPVISDVAARSTPALRSAVSATVAAAGDRGSAAARPALRRITSFAATSSAPNRAAADRTARALAQGIVDGAGGSIIASIATLPDGRRRVVVQRLDANGLRQWGVRGAEVATPDGEQTDPDLVSDGSGGALVVWLDTRSSAPGLYAQRLDATGARQWGDTGVAFALADPNPGSPRAASDGAGGLIATWQDHRDGSQYDIYARRVDASGAPLWANDGVKLYSNAFDQLHPVIASDAAGGAVIAWEDQRSGVTDLYAQRVSATGVRRWGAAGVAVCAAIGEQLSPAIAASDTFFVMGWLDTRAATGDQIYTQRLDRNGVPGWMLDGVPVCTRSGVRGAPVVAGDGSGGAFLAWSEKAYSPYWADVFAQHITTAGVSIWTADGVGVFVTVAYQDPAGGEPPQPAIAPDGVGGLFAAYQRLEITDIFQFDITYQHLDAGGLAQFPGNGEIIGGAPLDQMGAAMTPDGSGGFVAWWTDGRSRESDVYVQRVNSGGASQWASNGVPVSVGPGLHVIAGVVPDGAGGVIVGYAQKIGTNYDIFARRFDAAGHPVWPPVPVCTASEFQGFASMIEDGAGGAVLVWSDFRNFHEASYAQRVDASGTPRWTTDGVLLKDTGDWTETFAIVPDGVGGLIIPFRQLEHVPAGLYDIWAQRLDADGARLWGDSGVPVCQFGGDVPWYPVGVPDGAGGAVIAWEDWNVGDQMYAQRLDATGSPRWVFNGRLVESSHQQLTLPAIAPDGLGGAILAWEDNRTGGTDPPDIYAQHLDDTGALAWPAAGLMIANGPRAQSAPRLLPDGSGGVFLAWSDDQLGTGPDLVARRFAANGTALWTGGPRSITAQSGAQERPWLVSDGAGGFIACWVDRRAGAGTSDIYAQRMDPTGAAIWAADGIPVCAAPGIQLIPVAASDGASGAFVGWMDARDGASYQVYLQRLSAAGDTLFVRDGITDVRASLVSVEALPGRIRLLWNVLGGVARFEVERCAGADAWTVVGVASPDGSGYTAFEDRGVADGKRYGYRLAWPGLGGRNTAGETWVDVPDRASMALESPRPNPTSGPLQITFTLPQPGRVALELVDIAGRRVEDRTWSTLEPGVHQVTLGAGRSLAAGVYLVRLTQGGASIVRRVCVIR